MSLQLVLERVEPVTGRVSLFTFAAAAGALPAYGPGAHVVFDLGAAGRRAYSLVDFAPPGPRPSRYRFAVQREDAGGGGSRAMHALRPGDRLEAEPPRNDFPLHDGAAPALLIAGGIGVTPIISFATELKRRGTPFAFHYATRDAANCAFRERLEAAFGERLTLWFDDGRAIDLEPLVAGAPAAAHIYCCGPEGMIRAVRALAEAAGRPAGRVHFELFSAPAAGDDDDRPFEIEIASTGQVLTVPPGRSIVEVLEEAGLDPLHDCGRGDCGVCRTGVLAGEPDHRDVVLSEAERAAGDVMQICVSRARSPRLVLDL